MTLIMQLCKMLLQNYYINLKKKKMKNKGYLKHKIEYYYYPISIIKKRKKEVVIISPTIQ